MRGKGRHLGLFAALVLVAVVAGSTMAGAHGGWYGWGHDDDGDNSHEIKRMIDSRKPKNVILLIGDGMGDSEITLARYYGKGAEGTLNMETLPFTGELTTYNLSPGPGPEYAPNYVARLGADGDRLVDRSEDDRRPPLAGPECRRDDPRLQRRLHDDVRDCRQTRHAGRQRLHRGDHRRDPGGAVLAHLAPRLPGPGRHAHALPDRGQAGGWARLDRRAADRPPARRQPGWRPRPLPTDDRRQHRHGHRLRQRRGLRATSRRRAN